MEKVCGTEAHKIQGSTTIWSVKTDHCGDLQLHEHVPLPLQLYTANHETGQKHVNIYVGGKCRDTLLASCMVRILQAQEGRNATQL